MKIQVTREVLKTAAIPATAWRPIDDNEAPAAIEALAAIVGKKQASQPSMVRRLALAKDGASILLTVDVPVKGGLGWYPWEGSPSFHSVAYPLEVGVAILQSPLNPEVELAEMRTRHDTYVREQEQKAADEARRASEIRKGKEKLEQERRVFRGDDWGLLCGWQRFAAALGLAVEKQSPELASAIRGVLAKSLAGADEDFPRARWSEGLALDGLDGSRRAGLEGAARDEKDRAILASCPPRTRDQISLMSGSDLHAQADQWRLIDDARRRERELQAQAAAGEQARVATRDQVAADRAMPRRLDRDSAAQRAAQVGKGA